MNILGTTPISVDRHIWRKFLFRKKKLIQLLTTFLYILEKSFKILTSLSFHMSFLLDLPLSSEIIWTFLAFPAKTPWFKEQLIASVKGFSRNTGLIFISFGGVISRFERVLVILLFLNC